MTRKEKLLTALCNGEQLTAKQIAARFNLANPTAAVNTLRMEGYPIYLNQGSKDNRGRVRASKYRLGTASRNVIAAGYKALANGLV